MKTVMIVLDGLGDEPVPELNGATPLAAAFIPNTHYIATRGRVGQIRTTFDGFPIESMVCIMGLLGYEPARFYPSGRASFEAMARGIPLADADLVLRCNIVGADDAGRVLTDFTAGLITDGRARAIVSHVHLPCSNWQLFSGQSYRNILVVRDAHIDPRDIVCREPHMHIGEPIADLLPRARSEGARGIVEELRTFLLATQRQIAGMDAHVRGSASMLWVWSPSVKPCWPSFTSRTGLRAAVVGGLDFLHGIAMAAGIHFDVIPGATGYIDTDYEAKGRHTIDYLEDFDFVLTHVNATDEEAHQRNHRGKIDAIEKADRHIVGPVLRALEKRHAGNFRVVVCGDHETRCRDGRHTDAPVPYALYGAGVDAGGATHFSEATCANAASIPSLDFLRHVVTAGASSHD